MTTLPAAAPLLFSPTSVSLLTQGHCWGAPSRVHVLSRHPEVTLCYGIYADVRNYDVSNRPKQARQLFLCERACGTLCGRRHHSVLLPPRQVAADASLHASSQSVAFQHAHAYFVKRTPARFLLCTHARTHIYMVVMIHSIFTSMPLPPPPLLHPRLRFRLGSFDCFLCSIFFSVRFSVFSRLLPSYLISFRLFFVRLSLFIRRLDQVGTWAVHGGEGCL